MFLAILILWVPREGRCLDAVLLPMTLEYNFPSHIPSLEQELVLMWFEGVPESSEKSQNEGGQEDQGEVPELGRTP